MKTTGTFFSVIALISYFLCVMMSDYNPNPLEWTKEVFAGLFVIYLACVVIVGIVIYCINELKNK